MAAVAIRGLNDTIAAMTRIGVESQDLRDAFDEVGQLALAAAQRIAPKGATGKLSSGPRKSRRRNAAILRQSTPTYWPYAMFGAVTWPRPVPFLYLARDEVSDRVAPLIERNLDLIIARAGF